jgi:hypothetical protein
MIFGFFFAIIPSQKRVYHLREQKNFYAFILENYHDKRIELPIIGLLPLNRRKNAATWKAQGIGAEFHGISRRGSPWNWSG